MTRLLVRLVEGRARGAWNTPLGHLDFVVAGGAVHVCRLAHLQQPQDGGFVTRQSATNDRSNNHQLCFVSLFVDCDIIG